MAQIVLLKGVNVGGHRSFRPSQLAEQLRHLGAVNIGAAGSFVIRERIGRVALRAEFARRLPFASEIVICRGTELVKLLDTDAYAGQRMAGDETRFVSVLARNPRSDPRLPLRLPARGRWLVKLVLREQRFVLGCYRRDMRTIRQLDALEGLFGVAVTTRSWRTLTAIARALERQAR